MSHTSRVDFSTTCYNSSKLHIILSPVGHLDDNFIDNVPRELSKVPLPNSQQLTAKFVLHSTPLQNDWSDVQYYRRPIGLLCITHVDGSSNNSNLTTILPQYEKVKRRLESTVIDSRCIIFSKEALMLPQDCIRPDIMVIQYSGTAESIHCEELTAMIGEFTQALFSVLVRKTIELGTEKYNSLHLLYSPYERSKPGLDEGKTGKRRIQGRHKKHLGDLYLLVGKPDKAHEAYEEALKILLAIGDSMWIGAAYEGQCCAIASLIQLEGTENRASALVKADRFKGSQDSLNSLSSEPELKSEENISRTFRNALNSMEKVREATLIMLESTLKFIRLMIELDSKREACEVISNEIWYGYEDLAPVERLQLFCTVAMLYEGMGMTRKYSYYLRRAALESIQERMLSRAYSISSSLLCNVIEKYGVLPGDKRAVGWPRLQKLVLEDLISVSDKLANSGIVVRYGMCLLQNFYSHLTQDDQLRILNLIFKNNTRLEEHVIEVPNVPICKKITLTPLSKSLQPLSTKQSSSVFIFAPMTTKEKEQNPEVWWVCEEFGEVHVKLENPLFHALELFDIRCVIEGGDVDCYPATMTIQPTSTIDIVLMARPHEPTTLRLTGLKLQICGVPCNINLDITTEIHVSRAMPLLTVLDYIPPTLSLYEGEKAEFKCRLANNGTFPIEKLDIVESKHSSMFKFNPIPLPLLPNCVMEFTVRIDTKIRHNQRAKCFDEEDRPSANVGQRRGTIYENSSSEENLDILARTAARRKRVKVLDQVFVEEMFSISLRYYDKKVEFYRQIDIQFNTQITLLYKLESYRITQHPLNSELCKWQLTLMSICPVRMEIKIAGTSHYLDPGELITTFTDLDRVEGSQGEPTVNHRVKYSDLLPSPCCTITWSIGEQAGSLNLIESVAKHADLAHAFKEAINIRCEVAGKETTGDRIGVKIGAPIPLKLYVTNTSGFNLYSMLLYTRTYSDKTTSTKTMCNIPFIGSRDLDIPSIPSNASISHSFSLLPMTCGSFYVEVGACVVPPTDIPASTCTVQYNSLSRTATTMNNEEVEELAVVPQQIIMQNLNEGRPPPKYIKSWKMRPCLYFDISK